MAISIFPSTAAEFVSNNFVIDMNDTTNNTADTGGVKQAGPYSMSFSSGDTSFDVYLIDDEGNSVGYSNSTSINASGLFSTVVILGVAQDEVISFTYQGSVNNADGEGDEPGAGAYLESISPTDLPTIDDTATVTGGNFASDVEVTFESGATVLSAKNIVRNSSTELVVTRPDDLIEDNSPYTVRAVNAGVPQPSGSDANLLVDEVTAGSDPTWVTGANLPAGEINVAYVGATLEATDSDGTVTDYSVTSGALPTGLSLNSSTGAISGTPTGSGQVFTVTATDDGGNTTPKEFTLPVQVATGGTITTIAGTIVHTFSSTDDFIAQTDIANASFVVIGGGGGTQSPFGGGGGGGGVISTFAPDSGSGASVTITAGTHTATIGAGGFGSQVNGGSSSFGAFGTALGGGGGGADVLGASGAAGGGGGRTFNGGTGSNGGDGGDGGVSEPGSGGGGGSEGTDGGNAGAVAGVGTTTTIRGSSERFSDGGNVNEGGSAFTANSSDTGGDGAVIVRYV